MRSRTPRRSSTASRSSSTRSPRRTSRAIPEPLAVALSFIDAINRGDVEALGRLMTPEHTLVVFDEPPLVGREANVAAWRRYLERFPRYAIHPHRTEQAGRTVAIYGHTAGSHLGLPDREERQITVVWRAEVVGDALRSWTLTAPE